VRNWHRKAGPTVALMNDNRRIKINDYSLSLFPFNWMCNRNKWAFLRKILLFVRDWGEGCNDQMLGVQFWVTGPKTNGLKQNEVI